MYLRDSNRLRRISALSAWIPDTGENGAQLILGGDMEVFKGKADSFTDASTGTERVRTGPAFRRATLIPTRGVVGNAVRCYMQVALIAMASTFSCSYAQEATRLDAHAYPQKPIRIAAAGA